MYLKSLKLVGFKSFADRTRMEFRPGVTVIVGPNGSGKSNIVDAVAWVMGTQSTRALRTGKMEDVIFAGTVTRPGLGRAEVTITFDNGDGRLPLDLAEVSITRRLYRDGSSDYEINGVACRLLDIQELLSDSGVGRHQHVIVGQGQIDSVLNAGPDQHRAVIEEAAGILKHKVRRQRAERRLERTDADVLRLHDLLGELKRQMRPLKRQAEAAARHDDVAGLVRALHLYLGGRSLARIDARLGEIDAEDRHFAEVAAAKEAEAAELDAAVGILEGEAGETGRALDRDTAAAARLETTVERLRRIVSVAQERRRSILMRLEGADERRRDLEGERESLRVELADARTEEAETRRRAAEAEVAFRTLEDEERSLASQEGLSTEGALAVVRGDLRSLEETDRRDLRELESVEHRIEVLAGRIAAGEAQADEVRDEIAELDRQTVQAQDSFAKAQQHRQALQASWEEIEDRHRRAETVMAAARAKLEALEQAATRPFDEEARAAVESAPGARGALAALLDVPAVLAAAVDAALGPWAHAVAFGDASAVDAAVRTVKHRGIGGIALVASDAESPCPARVAAEELGVEALCDLLGPNADRRLATRLLGDVVLVEGWTAARRIVATRPDLRAVTPEGDLVTAEGVAVAHPDGATPAMVEAAAVAVEEAERELARSHSLLTSRRRAFDDARAAERDTLERLEALEARLSGSVETLARLERTVEAAQEEAERLTERRRALVAARERRAEQIDLLRRRLDALEGEEAERQRAWEELAARRRRVAAAREQARAAWQEAAGAARAAAERVRLLESRLAAVEEALTREETPDVEPEDLARLERVEVLGRRLLAVAADRLRALRQRQAELRERLGDAATRLEQARARRDEARAEAAAAADGRSALAVEATELRVRREAVVEGLRRDADASEEEALTAGPPPGVDPDADLEALLETKVAELRRMGPVNPLAAEEYRNLEERHEFLRAQLDDLERSRDELRQVIRALDEEIQTRFVEAYEEVAAAFERHFAVLFPGGKGRLRLTDPDDPLGSGVEIEAQPLGKKIGRLSLLSGGERSLAALAFLFAVFTARPSPFYILDEVEAALDDANLRRFLRLLDRFRDEAQLIVVTHQQQTMEAADVLYGVTMEPGGSSRVVAKPMVREPVSS